MGESDSPSLPGRTDNLSANVNVTAYQYLNKRNSGSLYDGDVTFKGGDYSLIEGDKAKNGFLRTLEDVAAEIEFILVEETKDLKPFRRHDVFVTYESTCESDSTFGARGYSSEREACSRRSLTDSEMKSLIRKTYLRLKKSLYKDKKK